jgi:pimeloyl-ACP methyl ester carboxylesterase
VAERRPLTFRGQSLVVDSDGEGPVVGYLHGMVGCPVGHPFLPALAARGLRVVAPSLPGFTGSAARDDLRNLFDWVHATSEVVDIAGLAGRPLIASSIGAMLALEVAAIRPEAFSALTLIAPFGLWDEDAPTTDPFATTFGSQRALLTRDTAATEVFYTDPAGETAEALVELNVGRYTARTAAASLIWPIPEFGLATRLHRVTCPVRLVWGSDDRIIPVSYLQRFAALLPNVVSQHVVDGAGHLAELDEPSAIASLLV